jgi:hypothetical protein
MDDDRDGFVAWAADLFRNQGWIVHNQPVHRPGLPDLVALKRGRFVFVTRPTEGEDFDLDSFPWPRRVFAATAIPVRQMSHHAQRAQLETWAHHA